MAKRAKQNDAKAISDAIIKSHERQIKGLDERIKKLADSAAKRVRKLIRSQAENWEPLNEDYEAFKKRTGLDTRKLIASKEYIESIVATKVGTCQYRVGPSLKKKHSSGLPLWKLARMLEYGNVATNLPARPHYRPVLDQVKEELKDIVKTLKRQGAKK